MANRSRSWPALLWAALALAAGVGIFGRGYWTPDEPREADLAWRMSWQSDRTVPLLAGEPFCEKPPLTYWVAGAAIRALGPDAWAARLPNVLYALITALAVGSIGRRSAGPIAGAVAAAAISTFLLAYQVAIWLATDAPLLASVSVALLGLYLGFYAGGTGERLRGYSSMHAALALGFLSKSAAAWMVPALAFATLVIWEKRWRELLRWELYVGLALQAALILPWLGLVYRSPEGSAHLKVFFWNNLVGRFAHVEAPDQLQYAAAHRNSPGKYFLELPVYLWPWTLLVAAAARRAWRRRGSPEAARPVRFACATFLPSLGVLSVAATARNIYLAPALPGLALLLGWWASDLSSAPDRWDMRAVRATALLLAIATLVLAAAAMVVGWDSKGASASPLVAAFCVLGLFVGAGLAWSAWLAAGRGLLHRGLFALTVGYCALLMGPALQIYRQVDTWQALEVTGRAIERDSAGRPLILFSPDETTRAFVDMYARTAVDLIPGPVTPESTERLRDQLARTPSSQVVTQLPGRGEGDAAVSTLARRLGLGRLVPARSRDVDQLPVWASGLHLRMAHLYSLPNGRRYALVGLGDSSASR